MIDILFSIINFGIIIGLLTYAIIRYAIPGLKKKVFAENKFRQDIHDEHRQVLAQQKRVDVSTERQDESCITLKEKIDSWKSAVHVVQREQVQEREQLLNQADERLKQQLALYRMHLLQKNVAPLVANQLERDLRAYFSDESKGHAYIDSVIKGLK